MTSQRMRKSVSEARFGIDELVDLGEPIEKLACTQNLRSMFHRVPSLGQIGLHRLESINKLSKNKTKYFGYLMILILLIVIGALFARVAFKRVRESKHMKLAQDIGAMEEPAASIASMNQEGKLAIVEALQAKDLTAFDVQLMSLRKYFKLSDISTFLIVVAPEDIAEVRRFVQSANSRHNNLFPFRIVEATSIVPELFFLTKHSESETAPYYKEHKFGYITRMIVKLAAAEWVSSDFYLALDADVLCVRPTSYQSLITEKGKANANFGPMAPQTAYQWKGAAQLLDTPESILTDDIVHGGVPSLYHRMGVHKLKTYLEIVYQQPWRYSLLRYLFGWSDYSLYYSFLKMAGLFEKYHVAKTEGVFRTKGVLAGRIGTTGWKSWDLKTALASEPEGSFVHLHGLLDADKDDVSYRIKPLFESL